MVSYFAKRTEVDVAKTTASGKSHGMRAVCKLGGMKALKMRRASLLNKVTIIYNLRSF